MVITLVMKVFGLTIGIESECWLLNKIYLLLIITMVMNKSNKLTICVCNVIFLQEHNINYK